ncbi:MAG: hypothetical protein J5645_02400 [Lachnospiraceae bacterium]|nr:hypothetical protein [Lachnospiraceae bacterium]
MQYRLTKEKAKLLGRTHTIDGTLWLSLSASGAEWKFTGTFCKVTFTGDAMAVDEIHSPRFAVEVDGKRIMDTTLVECNNFACGFSGAPAEHVVRVLKLSESADSTLGIVSVECDGVPEPTPAAKLAIEFVGDSITCGYGVDGTINDIYKTTNEDATKGYAYRAAQLLSADYSLVSFSGYGIISGYTETGRIRPECVVPPIYGTMGDSYGAFAGREKPSEVAWDFSKFTPDIVVINLGTNDASYCGEDPGRAREYISAYKVFLSTVRACNPQAYLVCALGTMDTRLCGAMETAAEEFKEETRDARVATVRLTLQDMERDGVVVDWHPSAVTHQKAAEEIAAFLRGLTL